MNDYRNTPLAPLLSIRRGGYVQELGCTHLDEPNFTFVEHMANSCSCNSSFRAEDPRVAAG